MIIEQMVNYYQKFSKTLIEVKLKLVKDDKIRVKGSLWKERMIGRKAS